MKSQEYFKFMEYYDFRTVQFFQASLFILVTENMWGVLSEREGSSGLPEVMFNTLDWEFRRNFQIKSSNILSFSYLENSFKK